MKSNKSIRICAWSVGALLICTSGIYLHQRLSSREEIQSLEHQDLISQLAKANIVYLGETHDSLADRQAQLEIIQSLYQRHPQLTIALEMFQHPFQPALDRYLAGEIDEMQLRAQTEYDQRWGLEWEFLAPILRFARQHKIPLLALNTPREITRKVARWGLESLTTEELQYIPPLSSIRTDNQEYRQMLLDIYQQTLHGKHGHSINFEGFFVAQVLWDETMAENLARYYQTHREHQIVVLAGKNHIIYGYGIPQRVQRRLNGDLLQRSVLMGTQPEFDRNEVKPADFFWQHK